MGGSSWCLEITTRRQDRSIFSSSLITGHRPALTTGISHSQDVRSRSVSLTDVFSQDIEQWASAGFMQMSAPLILTSSYCEADIRPRLPLLLLLHPLGCNLGRSTLNLLTSKKIYQISVTVTLLLLSNGNLFLSNIFCSKSQDILLDSRIIN